MIPVWMSTVASIGMAVGPSLVYVDQAISIIRKGDSTGFSHDVCAILLLSHMTRCFFWLGDPFEFALLLQSLLLILAQLVVLYICVRYKPAENLRISRRPFSFWQWPTFPQYVEFLAGFILLQTILYLIFGRFKTYITILGFAGLGLESMLPIPQLITNFKQRSLYGFRSSALLGWIGGDAFKTVYFFVQRSPLPFKVCAIFQLSLDCVIALQRVYYGTPVPVNVLRADEDMEEAVALVEDQPDLAQ